MNAAAMILLAGLFDRMRGSGWCAYCHFIGMLGMGAALALLLGLHGWTIPAFVAAWCVGAAPGWGNPLGAAFDFRPMGANYEWWQAGILRQSVPLALLARGVIWTAPTLLLVHWAPAVLIFAPLAALAFPLSVYVARDIPGSRGNAWAVLEFMRGALIGLAAYTAKLCT